MNPLSAILYGYSAYKFLGKKKGQTNAISDFDANSFKYLRSFASDYLSTNRDILYNTDYSEVLNANVIASFTSITNEYWDAKFAINIKNLSKVPITLCGILVKWRLSGVSGDFLPCTIASITIAAGQEKSIDLDGANNRHIVDDKTQRGVVRQKLKTAGKGVVVDGKCDIYFVLNNNNGTYAIRKLEGADFFATWDGNANYADCGNKHQNRINYLKELIRVGESGLPFQMPEQAVQFLNYNVLAQC